MDCCHDLFPDLLVVGSAASDRGDLLVIITSGPDSRRVIRGKSDEPDIVVARCRTGFTGIGHPRDISHRTGGV